MISAIVVNRNGERYLARCLESLVAAGVDELLLVDNDSSDGSLDLVRRQFPAVELLAQTENLGFARANNLAAARAGGDLLLLVNCDAWLGDECLPRLHTALAADAGLGLVAPRLRYPEGTPQFVWAPDRGLLGELLQRQRNPFERRRWSHRPLERLLRVLGPGWCSAACVLVRRAAFEAVGGFDEGYFLYFEDVDLCLRLRRLGWRLAVVQDAVAFHAGGAGWREGTVDPHYRRSQLRYYRTHRPRWEAAFLRWYLRRKLGPSFAEDT